MANPTTVTRGSECFITATYLTNTGVGFVPAAVSWRLDDLTNQKQLQTWTPIPGPTLSDTITIPSTLNVMSVATDTVEKFQVTFKVTTPDGNYRYDTIVYDLVNLYGAA